MRSAIKVAWAGGDEMKRNIKTVIREFPLAVRRAVKEWAEQKAPIAVDRAPEKTGKLKRSVRIRVSVNKRAGKENTSASIVFGGPDVLYARRVHDLNPKHPDKEKFLERTIREAVPTAGAEIAEKVSFKREQTWLAGLKKAQRKGKR